MTLQPLLYSLWWGGPRPLVQPRVPTSQLGALREDSSSEGKRRGLPAPTCCLGPSVATWGLRLGALLCCAWTLGVLTGQGGLCPAPPNWVPAHPQYFILLLIIFLLEIIAGILAYIYYQQVRGLDGQEHGGTHAVRWTCAYGDTQVHACRDTYIHTHTHRHDPPCSRADHWAIRPWAWGWVTVGTDSRDESVHGIWSSLPVPNPVHGHLVTLPAQPPLPSQHRALVLLGGLPEPLPHLHLPPPVPPGVGGV